MKKLLCAVCLVFLLTGCGVRKIGISVTDAISEDTAEAEIISSGSVSGLNSWQNAYKQVLLDFIGSDEYFQGNHIIYSSAFSVYDLNADGTPELIISPNTSHAASCDIYTYDNELVFLGKMGSYGGVGYYEDNGMIVHSNIGQGIEYEIFNRLENGSINLIANFFNDLGYSGEDQAVFKLNDTEITRDEYNAELKKYRGYEYIDLGRDHSFDEIDTAFTEYSRIISIGRAAELLSQKITEYEGMHTSYHYRQVFDDRTYYVFYVYEDHDDRRVNTGWYAVDPVTGECLDITTEPTPLFYRFEITENGIEVYEKYGDEPFQVLSIDPDFTPRPEWLYEMNEEYNDPYRFIRMNDFDFDGYDDISVQVYLGATNATYQYYRYDPLTRQFENWNELNEFHYGVTPDIGNKTLSVYSKSSAVDSEDTVYKWAGDQLIPVSAEKRYWNEDGIIMDYLEYDDNGNEILVRREKQVHDDDGNLIGVTDVTPQ